MTRKRFSTTVLTLTALVSLGACNEVPMSYGDANSIIAVMPLEQWEEYSEDVYAALEPTIQTVRNEKTFTVTYQEPYAEFWDRLRRFRQMVVVGTREDRPTRLGDHPFPDRAREEGLPREVVGEDRHGDRAFCARREVDELTT